MGAPHLPSPAIRAAVASPFDYAEQTRAFVVSDVAPGNLDQLAAAYEVIPMDASMFREWARLMAGKSDHLLEDAMIAATARVRGLVVVTRNVRDFEMFRVEVLNPFKSA